MSNKNTDLILETRLQYLKKTNSSYISYSPHPKRKNKSQVKIRVYVYVNRHFTFQEDWKNMELNGLRKYKGRIPDSR